MSSERQLILGIFFVVVFAILTYFTLFLTDFQLFGEKIEKNAYFSQTNGLREGDPVLVAGMRWGKVEALVFDPVAEERERVTVTFSINQHVDLHDDHTIRIADATLLGGKNLEIDPGSASSPVIPRDTVLYGTVAPNVMKAIEEVVSENRASLRETIAGIESVVTDLRASKGTLGRILYDEELGTGFAAAVANFSSSFDNINVLSRDLRRGSGTFGKLLTDDGSAYEELSGILTSARTIVDNAREGKGAVGKLLSDEKVAKDIEEFIENMSSISASAESIAKAIDDGEGLLGVLAKDKELADDVALVFRKLADGEGTLGKLITEDEVYDDLVVAAESLRKAFEDLNEGDGTIAKLIHDDEFYQDMRIALAKLTGSLEEAREAAPISTFLNTVFLGF